VPIPGISDHEAVNGELCLAVKIQVPARRTVYMWHKAHFNEIRQYISNFSTSFLHTFSTFSDVDLLWERLCHECLKMIPSKLSPENCG